MSGIRSVSNTGTRYLSFKTLKYNLGSFILRKIGYFLFPVVTIFLIVVAQLCPTLCSPMNCSRPGFPVLHHIQSLLKLMSIELMMSSNISFVTTSSSHLQSFSASEYFPMSQVFTSGGQKYWSFSISTSNEYSEFISFRMTGLISLLSEVLSRVFSSTPVQKHQFFGAQPSLWSNIHIHT